MKLKYRKKCSSCGEPIINRDKSAKYCLDCCLTEYAKSRKKAQTKFVTKSKTEKSSKALL